MSRRRRILFAIALFAPIPAIAQTSTGTSRPATASAASGSVSEEDRAIAQRMMGTGRVTAEPARQKCLRETREARPGEIVVCAPDEDKYRVQSTSQEDPLSDQALNDGRLTPPDVAGNGIFKGKATATFGKVDKPYLIDLKSIPEAPAGSDADKIAKGEMRAH